MNYRLVHKITAAAVFLISLVVLILTVQPSVSFWDCGEFISASYYLQVPHPPGTPFFLFLGRIASLLPIAGNIALRVNLISVLSSALSILFLYLTAVKLIENYRGKDYKTPLEALSVFIAAAIGALSFAFSDTFWFNGVEAEVYAFSTFLFGAITYLMLRWNERADSKDNEKYLLMIAYLVGLSTGVHLMSVLAVIPVVMIIIFRKYLEDEEALKKTAYIFLGHVAVLLIIAVGLWVSQKSSTPPSPEEYGSFDSKVKMIFVGVSILIMAIFWKRIFNRNSFYLPLIIGSAALFITYPGIVKNLPELINNIAGDNIVTGLIILALILGALAYGVNYSIKNNKPTLHLVGMSLIFALVGFTTFAMVIIRANQDPPMNENDPNTFTELVSYLNREQYGDFPTFKRRFATEPHQMVVYNNYSSDLDFFWNYQMHHMMTRYLLWNYAGREGWNQDDGANMAPFNFIGNIFFKIFGVQFNGQVKYSLFGIPFLLGLLGIYFHFRRDWKMASAFMIAFILMGYLTAFYQNQQQPQPRERDYFYVGAFFVYSIWIAIGLIGLIDVIKKKVLDIKLKNAAVIGVLALGIIFVPINMLRANYFTHDRSNNWVPWDYSYNLLQSCAPNSILFTNGDNDTFPLWYLQDVEGIRRDVKIVNLSLVNTDWYISQLKNNDPYNVGTVKLRLTDEQIAKVQPIQWEPRDITIPLPGQGSKQAITDLITKYDIKDSSVIKAGALTFRMNNTLTFGDVKAIRVQDIMVKEIVEANNWERPIYFAVTCSEDSKIGLSDYLKMEGMALKLTPEKRTQGVEFLNAEVLRKQLYNTDLPPSKSYQPGFRLTGLNDPNIFFDENHTRMTQNYRNAFLRLAIYYVNTNQKQLAINTLDRMEEKIPMDLIPLDFGPKYELSNIYFNAGGMKQFNKIAKDVEEEAWQMINDDPAQTSSYWNPYRILLDLYENQKNYNKLVEVWQRIEVLYPQDQNVKMNLQRYKQLAAGQSLPDTNIKKDTAK